MDLADPKWLRINDFNGLVSVLDHQHGNFTTEVSRGSKFTGALQGFCNGLEAVIGLFGGAASAAFPPCSQVLGAVSVLIGAGKRVTGAFDAVDGLFQRIGEFVQRLQPITAHQVDPALERIVVGLMVSLLRICALASRKIYYDEDKEASHRSKIWQKVKRSAKSKTVEYFRQLFTGGDSEIDGVVAQLERLVDAEMRMTLALVKKDSSDILSGTEQIQAVTVDIQGLSLTIRDATYDIKRDATEIKFHVTAIEADIVDMKRLQEQQLVEQSAGRRKMSEIDVALKNLTGRLNPAQPVNSAVMKAKKHAELLKTLLEPPAANKAMCQRTKLERQKLGTCNWILDEPCVKQWFAHETSIVAVSGKRGTGKTFLAARIIEELQTRFNSGKQDLSSSFAYFFCSKDSRDLSSIPRMLRSLAYQICECDNFYTTHIDTPARRDHISQGGVERLWKVLFHEFFSSSNRYAMIVVDGLNEIEEEPLIEFLQALKFSSASNSAWSLPSIQFIFCIESEWLARLQDTFGDLSIIEVHRASTEIDLKGYLERRLDNEWKQHMISNELRSEVEATLLAQCQGNFLWLSSVLDGILSRNREDSIRYFISDLPKDEKTAMMLVLDRLSRRLDREELEDLWDILAWTTCAEGEIRLDELDCLLAMRKSQGSRVLNLERLLCEDWAALFVTSRVSDVSTEEIVYQRLGEDSAEDEDLPSKPEAELDTQITAGQHDETKSASKTLSPGGDLQRRLEVFSDITVKLAGDIVKQLKSLVDDCGSNEDASSIVAAAPGLLSMQKMRLKVLIRCLEIMCADGDISIESFAIPFRYCALHLPDYLDGAEISVASTQEKSRIASYLLRILKDTAIIDRWIKTSRSKLIDHLLASVKMQETVHSWLQDPEVELAVSDREWVTSASRDVLRKGIYRNIAAGHAHLWLQSDTEGDDIGLNFKFLNIYLEKKGGQITAFDRVFIFDAFGEKSSDDAKDAAIEIRYGLENSSADRILQVARWAALKEDRDWNRQVARAMEVAECYPEAIELYHRAIDLDPENPALLYSLASCHWDHGASKSDEASGASLIHAGIDPAERGVKLSKGLLASNDGSKEKESIKKAHMTGLYELGVFYRYFERHVESAEMFQEMLEDWELPSMATYDGEAIDGTIRLMGTLLSMERYKDLEELVERILKHPRWRQRAFWNIYLSHADGDSTNFDNDGNNMFQFAYKNDRGHLVDRFWDRGKTLAVRYGLPGHKSLVRYHQAKVFLHLLPGRYAEGIAILHEVYRDPAIATPANELHWVKDEAEEKLARHYLDEALTARDQDRWNEVGTNANQLYLLAQLDVNDAFGLARPILAAWFRLNGQLARAKLCARPHIEQALNMLYDDDEENDSIAWFKLSIATLAVGDERRGKAASAIGDSILVFGNVAGLVAFERSTIDSSDGTDGTNNKLAVGVNFADDSSTKESVEQHGSSDPSRIGTPEAAQPPFGGKRFYKLCDGPCIDRIFLPNKYYVCSYCMAVFCESCNEMIQSGMNRKFKVCGSTHETVQMLKAEKCPPRMMQVDDQFVPIQDWLNDLADEWNIKRRTQATDSLE